MVKKIIRTVKELQKLAQQLEKLIISIISIVGWIYILIELLLQ